MKNGKRAVCLVIALMSGLLCHASADAGTVSIDNKFGNDIRVGIYAGVSESQVTVYRGEQRTYSSFVNKSISKINVVNLGGGANTELGSYTVATPSAATNYSVMVDSNGTVAVTVPVVALP